MEFFTFSQPIHLQVSLHLLPTNKMIKNLWHSISNTFWDILIFYSDMIWLFSYSENWDYYFCDYFKFDYSIPSNFIDLISVLIEALGHHRFVHLQVFPILSIDSIDQVFIVSALIIWARFIFLFIILKILFLLCLLRKFLSLLNGQGLVSYLLYIFSVLWHNGPNLKNLLIWN